MTTTQEQWRGLPIWWPGAAEPLAEELTPAWFEARRSGVGASEMPGLVGSGEPDQLTLYARKLGLVPDPEPGPVAQERMYWGRELQARLLEELARRAKLTIAANRVLYRSRSEHWMLATPDGAVLNEDGTVDVAEIKTTAAHREDDWADGVPFRVKVQAAQQLKVTGAVRAWVGCLIGGQKFVWDMLTRQHLEPVIEIVTLQGREFWRKVEAEEEPIAGPGSQEVLSKLYPQAVERTVDLAEHSALVENYLRVREQLKRAELDRDTLQARIKQAMGDAAAGTVPGVGRFTFKTVNKAGYTVAPKSYRELRFYPEGGS